jgi:hypothetical protein
MDARAQEAQTEHKAAARNDQLAYVHRWNRDRLVRELRAEDPGYWSYNRLARTIGCSKARIKQILEAEIATDPR